MHKILKRLASVYFSQSQASVYFVSVIKYMTLLVPSNRRYVASSTILIQWIHQVIHIRYFSRSTQSFIQKRFPDEVAKGPST